MRQWLQPLEITLLSRLWQTRTPPTGRTAGRGGNSCIATQTANSIRDIIWLINPAFDTCRMVAADQGFRRDRLRGGGYRLQYEGVILPKLPFDFRHHCSCSSKSAYQHRPAARARVVEVHLE